MFRALKYEIDLFIMTQKLELAFYESNSLIVCLCGRSDGYFIRSFLNSTGLNACSLRSLPGVSLRSPWTSHGRRNST